jgi:hypothetical protein
VTRRSSLHGTREASSGTCRLAAPAHEGKMRVRGTRARTCSIPGLAQGSAGMIVEWIRLTYSLSVLTSLWRVTS